MSPSGPIKTYDVPASYLQRSPPSYNHTDTFSKIKAYFTNCLGRKTVNAALTKTDAFSKSGQRPQQRIDSVITEFSASPRHHPLDF